MSWHKVEIPEGDAGEKQASDIIASFSRLFAKSGHLNDAALFETKLKITPRTLYFTPGAEMILGHILKAFSAERCGCPNIGTVTPLYANGDTDRFFR